MTLDVLAEIDSAMRLALYDAADNCARHGATVILTLRSGQQIAGQLQKATTSGDTTAHVKTASGGWVTVLIAEIAAIGAERRRG
jgi:hypothetical protein